MDTRPSVDIVFQCAALESKEAVSVTTTRRWTLRGLSRVECHGRDGHVRPKDVVEKENHKLRVLQLQVSALRPERLKLLQPGSSVFRTG